MASQKKTLGLTDTRMLKGREVAERLGMHPVSLSNMRQRARYNGPPYMKLGTRVRFPEDLLIEWMNKGLVMPDDNERVA
jgi:predicted DNA-binding transcriptional regulator AlpA